MASSESVGRRPSSSLIRAYSASVRPSSACGCGWPGVTAARPTVSTRLTRAPSTGLTGVPSTGLTDAPSTGLTGRPPPGSLARLGSEGRREEAQAIRTGAGEWVDRVLRVRHQAHHIAGLVADPRDVTGGSRRIPAGVGRA